MNIVHCIWAFPTGGTETMLVDIINEQVTTSKLNIIIINDNYNEDLINKIDKNVHIYLLKRKCGSHNPLPIIFFNILLFFINPDIIHCHNDNIINIINFRFRKKTILTIHNTRHFLNKNDVYKNEFDKYSEIFAISNSVSKDISDRFLKTPTIVKNGINLSLIKKKKLLYKDSIFHIVQVGRLFHSQKGQHLLLMAIELLVKSNKNIITDFIGSGDSEPFLKKLTKDLNIEPYVNFLGLQDRNYIYSHLNEYDLFIQPSLYEGFGLTVAEGMAAKLPVLVSDIEGPMEIINYGEFGYYFKTGDYKELANKIKFVCENYNSSEMNHKINEGYKYVEINYSVQNTAQNYLKEYKIITNQS